MTWLAAGGAVVSAWLVGTAAVAALWPRNRTVRQDLALVLPLGLGFGLGITSASFFAASLVVAPPSLLCAALELATLILALIWLRRSRARATAAPTLPRPKARWGQLILTSVFAQAAILAVVVAVRAYQMEPYSNSDGWAIWNMHARFLFRGGETWPEPLRASQIAWTHPDYPLLVPASVARAWAYVGDDAPAVAGLISGLFGIATVWLLVAAVARLRPAVVALVGGLVLLGTPFFVTFSSNQHADIPLAFYVLAAVTLLAVRDDSNDSGPSALLGAAAGLAAWTKNEGILFVALVGVIGVGWELKRRAWRPALALVAGAIVALSPLVYFKLSLSPANDLVASQPWGRISQLFDWSRHRLILATLWRDLTRFGEWGLVPFGAMVLPLLGRGWKQVRPREWTVLLVLALTLAGYYVVYLLTPWELSAHLDSSLVRLLMQLWPSAIFFWCLVATPPAPETPPASPRPAATSVRKWMMLVGANLLVLAGAFTLLNRQLAANQLTAATIRGARVHVLLADGWFGRETLGAERWAWSKGESTLLLRLDGAAPRTVQLRFTVRSLGARTLTAAVAGNVVWRAALADGAHVVQLPPLALSPGLTAIVLQTDAPGVPESAAAGARALTYAIYNPEVDE